MGKKASGKNTQAAYKIEGRCERNRKRRLERHLKKYPNDDCAKTALSNGPERRRYTPHKKTWGPLDKYFAAVYASVGISGNVVIERKKRRNSFVAMKEAA